MNKLFTRFIDLGFEKFVVFRYTFSHGLNGIPANEQAVINFWEQDYIRYFNADYVPGVVVEKGRAYSWGESWDIRFPSLISTASPENNLVQGRFFTHPGTPLSAARPVVLVIPGWLTFNYLQYYYIYRSFLKQGFDCLVMPLPYHLERTPEGCFSGERMLTPDLRHTMESFGQALSDYRLAVNWLLSYKAAPVGLLGISLGGLVGGLLATLEERLDFTSLWVPIPWMDRALRQSSICQPLRDKLFAAGVHWRELSNCLSILDPTVREPAIDVRRIQFVQGSHDQIVRPSWIERWWQAWDGPQIIRVPHGHCSVISDQRVIAQAVNFAQSCLP